MEYIFGYDHIEKTATEFLSLLDKYTVYAFSGDLGAGKTTFIKMLCQCLKVHQTVSSPTFSIINEYTSLRDFPIYHIDLYRIKGDREAIDAGVEECIFSSHLCFVEWPERAPGIFTDQTVKVYLETLPNMDRKMKIILPV